MKMTLMILSLFLLPYSIKANAEAEVIKSKDLKNSELNPTSGNDSSASMTPAQAEELKKQIEKLKENQKKSQQMLEELDKE